jgi:hypothetical protein
MSFAAHEFRCAMIRARNDAIGLSPPAITVAAPNASEEAK